MTTFYVQGYRTMDWQLEGWPVRVTSYRLGDRWACRVDNVSPGAIIARGHGPTRDEAENGAIERARARLRETKRYA